MLAHAGVRPLSVMRNDGRWRLVGSRWPRGRPRSEIGVLSSRAGGVRPVLALVGSQETADVVELAAPVVEPGRGPSGVDPGGILSDPALDQCRDGIDHR
jgi:hypothetical protein